MNLMDLKIRIQFDNRLEAVEHKKKYGGRVAVNEEKYYHYSYSYTPTEIFNDLKGAVDLY